MACVLNFSVTFVPGSVRCSSALCLSYQQLFLNPPQQNLRCMDINLFYQLVSLNESIQDFKLNASDRYSESGSEFSLGTASYMGSMSSLNEESEWEVSEVSVYESA